MMQWSGTLLGNVASLSLACFRRRSGLAWIIERLDRKLADAIVSSIVEKCDVTLSRAIQPHSTFCASYVSSSISLSLSSTIPIGHVLK